MHVGSSNKQNVVELEIHVQETKENLKTTKEHVEKIQDRYTEMQKENKQLIV